MTIVFSIYLLIALLLIYPISKATGAEMRKRNIKITGSTYFVIVLEALCFPVVLIIGVIYMGLYGIKK